MKTTARNLLLPGLILGLALAQPASANTWYRYQNEQGITVISHYVPPSLVHKGYEVLDSEGRVLRVVERQLSAEELRARDAERAQEAEAEQARQARIRRDRDLMTLYASPVEVELAKERRLASIENSMRTARANLERLQEQKRRLESQAAERERGGRQVPRELLENIRIVEMQIRETEREIESRLREQEEAQVQFDADYQRVQELRGASTSAEST